MKKLLKNTLFACLLTLPVFSPLLGHPTTKPSATQKRAIDLINYIEMTFETSYAPYLFKKERFGWEIQAAAENARTLVLNNPKLETRDARCLIRSLLASCNDYHVGALFASTEISVLPFEIYKADGRYFIIGVKRQFDPKFPFNPGDEITAINGRPIDECVEEIKQACYRSNNPATDQRLAEKTLTLRYGQYGDPIGKGAVTISGIKKGQNTVTHHQTSWATYPEKVDDHPYSSNKSLCSHQALQTAESTATPETILKRSLKKAAFRNMSSFYTQNFLDKETLESLAANPATPAENLDQLNSYFSKTGFLPALGKNITWSSKSQENKAYIFTLENGKSIGYLRLSSFMKDDDSIIQIAKILKFFQEYTDALVIDQTNNGGGYELAAYSLASMLINTPFPSEKDQVALDSSSTYETYLSLQQLRELNCRTDEDVQRLFGAKHIFGIPVNLKFFKSLIKHYNFLYEEWRSGKNLTNPTPTLGMDFFDPSPFASYTQPIVVLINELCMSCGDLFPALLQENKRAILFGTKTQGAGGAVEMSEARNCLGVHRIHFTTTLMHRGGTHEGKYIENEGVSPDVEYQITEEDIQNNFSGYVRELKKLLTEITNEADETKMDSGL